MLEICAREKCGYYKREFFCDNYARVLTKYVEINQ